MKLLLILLALLPIALAIRRTQSEPPPSRIQRAPPATDISKPLFEPIKASVKVWGPGTAITAKQGTRRTHQVDSCFREDGTAGNTPCAVQASTQPRGAAIARAKAERTHFLVRTGANAYGGIVAKGQGRLTGAIVGPNIQPVMEEVNGSKEIMVGPNSKLQGVLENHGRGRGRVSVTAVHIGHGKVLAMGDHMPKGSIAP